ncbi:Replicative DNA helicase (DnaB), partial [uncultured Rubrobacteraceae bacterium]
VGGDPGTAARPGRRAGCHWRDAGLRDGGCRGCREVGREGFLLGGTPHHLRRHDAPVFARGPHRPAYAHQRAQERQRVRQSGGQALRLSDSRERSDGGERRQVRRYRARQGTSASRHRRREPHHRGRFQGARGRERGPRL